MDTIVKRSYYDNDNLIKAYFLKVAELHVSGEAYPVDLEEVWPLAYSRKDTAVAALKKNFKEGEDYTMKTIRVEKELGSTQYKQYKMTSKCMEYYVAIKDRDVFNVYMEIFHQYMDKQDAREAGRAPENFADLLRKKAEEVQAAEALESKARMSEAALNMQHSMSQATREH